MLFAKVSVQSIDDPITAISVRQFFIDRQLTLFLCFRLFKNCQEISVE